MDHKDDNAAAIVQLTNFKKMSSTHDLRKEVPQFNRISEADDDAGSVAATKSASGSSLSTLEGHQSFRFRPRRKSWCVESSLKRQFIRQTLARRTVERSEGISRKHALDFSITVNNSPRRWAGLLDHRFRRFRMSGKAKVISFNFERSKDYSPIVEPTFPFTLAALKAQRKRTCGIDLERQEGFLHRPVNSPSVSSEYENSNERLLHFKDTLANYFTQTKSPYSPVIASNEWVRFDNVAHKGKCIEDHSDEENMEEIISYKTWLHGIHKDLAKDSNDYLSQAENFRIKSEKGSSLPSKNVHIEAETSNCDATSILNQSEESRSHIISLADCLNLTKDKLEDTAKCYYFLDKAYEWALEAMKILSRVRIKCDTYHEIKRASDLIVDFFLGHPPISKESFQKMVKIASKLENETLIEQCKMVHSRCYETMSLLRARQTALMKAYHEIEFNSRSYVDINEIITISEEQSEKFSVAWFNNCGRKLFREVAEYDPGQDVLSTSSSVEKNEECVVSDIPRCSTPCKRPFLFESKNIQRISDDKFTKSDEDITNESNFKTTEFSNLCSNVGYESFSLKSRLYKNSAKHSLVRKLSSGSSSCPSCTSSEYSSESKKERTLWDHSQALSAHEDTTDRLFESISRCSLSEAREDYSSRSNLHLTRSSHLHELGANSHLLLSGSQINLSNSKELSQDEFRRSKTLLLILQELIQTERDYANSLEYVIENYIPETTREDIPQALRGQRNVIFGNIEKIFEFHSIHFLTALESLENKPFAIGSVFLKFEDQFYLYALYNKNKPKSDELMAEFGTTYFKEKQISLGDCMDLASYLLKPVQRMGKYALLLKQLLKECYSTEEGYDELKSAQEMVQFQLRHGNDLLAMDSLRECDVNLKEQGRLLRQGEFLLTEGSRVKKSLRHIFLFEELILFSKSRKDPEKKNLDIFQYKMSLKTADIGITAQMGNNPLRFEIWFRKRKPADVFLLQASTAEMKESWIEEISKLLWRQALRNRKMRLHEMSSMGIGNKPCLDIKPSEDQINDRSVTLVPAKMKGVMPTSTLPGSSISPSRPLSILSASSLSSTESYSGSAFLGSLNHGFEPNDKPKLLQRSITRTSHCSAESGIVSDIFSEKGCESILRQQIARSNSTITSASGDSALFPSAPLSTFENSCFGSVDDNTLSHSQTSSASFANCSSDVNSISSMDQVDDVNNSREISATDALAIDAMVLKLPRKMSNLST